MRLRHRVEGRFGLGVMLFQDAVGERGIVCDGNTVAGARMVGIGSFDALVASVSENRVSDIGPTREAGGMMLSHGIVLNQVDGLQTFRRNEVGEGVLSVGFLLHRSSSPISLIVMNGRVAPDGAPPPGGCVVAQGEDLALDEQQLAMDNPGCDTDVRTDPASFLPVPVLRR